MISPLQFQQRFSGLAKTSAFTLTELLLAAAITGSAIAVSGIGLSAVISSSQAVNEGTERQDELNRAMDFISAEIREARQINEGTPQDFVNGTSFWSDIASVPVDETSVEVILWLDIATGGSDPNRNKVVYYVGQPKDPNGPWRSPQVVYRWGPEFDDTGRYRDEETDAITGNIEPNVEHAVLIDSMHDQIDSGKDPNCDGWQQAPDSNSVARNLGFYACVAPGNRVASLRQVGRINKTLGQSTPMPIERQVYARASETIAQPKFGTSGQSSNPSPCAGPSCGVGDPILPEDPNGRGFRVIEDSNLRLSHMGGAITCGTGGPSIATETRIMLDRPNGPDETLVIPKGGYTWKVPKGTLVNFVATRARSNCGSPFTVDSRDDTGTQVIGLMDGEEIPYYEPFDNQAKIEEFLTAAYLDGNRINIASNQKVFLFELGERFSSDPGPAYDFQDVVLLADIEPTSQFTTVETDELGNELGTSE